MTDWFARPVLHVTDVEASLRFYVNRLGFTSPWRYDEDGRAHVAQVDRQGCALILADTWPEKIGKGLMFISLNVEPETQEAAIAALDALRAELAAKGVSSSLASPGRAIRPTEEGSDSPTADLHNDAKKLELSKGEHKSIRLQIVAQ